MPDAQEIRLTLVPAGDDGDRFSEGCQRELRHFYDQLRAGQTQVRPRIFTMDSVGAGGGLVGEFVIPLAQVIGPVLGGAAVAWLQGRAGRKLRLNVGDVEVEARTPEEIEQLLKQAQALQTRQRGDQE
jgi:hypothetical protein